MGRDVPDCYGSWHTLYMCFKHWSESGWFWQLLQALQEKNMKAFSQLWKEGRWSNINYIIADKGYDYFDVRHLIKEAGKTPVIPRRANATVPGLPDNLKTYYHTRFCYRAFFWEYERK